MKKTDVNTFLWRVVHASSDLTLFRRVLEELPGPLRVRIGFDFSVFRGNGSEQLQQYIRDSPIGRNYVPFFEYWVVAFLSCRKFKETRDLVNLLSTVESDPETSRLIMQARRVVDEEIGQEVYVLRAQIATRFKGRTLRIDMRIELVTYMYNKYGSESWYARFIEKLKDRLGLSDTTRKIYNLVWELGEGEKIGVMDAIQDQQEEAAALFGNGESPNYMDLIVEDGGMMGKLKEFAEQKVGKGPAPFKLLVDLFIKDDWAYMWSWVVLVHSWIWKICSLWNSVWSFMGDTVIKGIITFAGLGHFTQNIIKGLILYAIGTSLFYGVGAITVMGAAWAVFMPSIVTDATTFFKKSSYIYKKQWVGRFINKLEATFFMVGGGATTLVHLWNGTLDLKNLMTSICQYSTNITLIITNSVGNMIAGRIPTLVDALPDPIRENGQSDAST